MGSKFISIVVPAHNEQEYLAQCLDSLICQDYPKEKYEIVVVDNNSQDSTRKIAKTFDVTIIDQRTGPVGKVRNAGARGARGELLAFIDADCVAPTDWISKGVKLLDSQGAVYGGGCDLRQNPFWIEKAWLLKNKLPPRELLGCCIFVKKTDFLKAGLFDENITSGEDTKLSVSLRNQGYQVLMTQEINVIHLGNPITLKNFFLRQTWHSENYLQNWQETTRDPTFYFLILFLLGSVSLISCSIQENMLGIAVSCFIIAVTPLVFTLKRLRRSKDFRKDLHNLPAIYFLDLIYLSGRIFGLFKSSWKAIRQLTSRQNPRVG